MNRMKNEIEKGISICVQALNDLKNKNKQSNHEGQYVLDLVKQLAQKPYQGKGLGIGDYGYRDYRTSWEGMLYIYEDYTTINHSLSWKDMFLLLCDAANYSEKDILNFIQQLDDNIIYNHIIKHIITNFVEVEDIDAALEYIPHFRTTVIFKKEDNRDKGYLIILKHYAKKGDDKNFFKYFKLCEPRKNRTEIADSKSWLIASYCANNSIEDALQLCKHKNLGKKFLPSVLHPFAEKGCYQELKAIFEKHPELKQPEIETELNILAEAYQVAKKNNIQVDDDFEQLFDRALQVDRKLRAGDVKLQDSILLILGLASLGNQERVLKCKKAIKNNSLKRELPSK